jgi:hypothetical protein
VAKILRLARNAGMSNRICFNLFLLPASTQFLSPQGSLSTPSTAVYFSKYYFGVHTNEDGMGGACTVYERDKKDKVAPVLN